MSAEPQQVDEEAPRLKGPREAFRVATHRNFGPYFLGNALSASGTWFQNLAASLLVFRLTHSAFLLGVLAFAQFIPVLVLAPWAGAAADRFDRKHLLLVTQPIAVVLSATLGALAFGGLAEAWVVIVFALGLGVVSAYSAPAQQALVSTLVPHRDLASAIALNSMTFNIARALGPAAAAATVAAFGIPAAFLVNASSYILFIGLLLLVHPRPQRRQRHASLRESLALVRANPRLLWLLFVVLAAGFASDPVNTEAPAFAHAFGRPDTFAGVIIGAFGAGAVGAAIATAGREGSARRTVVTLALLATGITVFALSPTLWIGFPFLVVAGFGYLTSNTRATAQLQLEVDESQRGRIMALWSVAFLGLRPVASLADGAIAGAFGVRAAGVVLALPALAAAVLIYLRVRATPSARPRQQEPPPEHA
ncbi:MAG: MFS transporter [Gaiellaceae bacterium]